MPLTLASGQSAQITIQFKPNASGQASSKLTLYSKAANSPTTELLSGTGVAASAHSVSLSWQRDANPVIGYNVYRGTQSGGPYGRINNALESTTDYNDNSVVAGKTYFYAATAVNAQGHESGYSNKVKVVIPYP
jgi:fibronectin type 3 domain-containing protein